MPASDALRFFVPGYPRPKGSKRIVRGRLIEASRYLPEWDEAVQKAAFVAAGGAIRISEPVSVVAMFNLHWSAKKTPPRVDVDKLARAVLDSLVKAGILADDSLVTHLTAMKREGPPYGVFVQIAKESKDDIRLESRRTATP
jgi:Holliday junction resolvase RusA-like endonuclease